MLCGVAGAIDLVQDRLIDEQFTQPALSGKLAGICVFPSHDATPIFVRFGKLQQWLEPFARFLYFCEIQDRWLTLDYNTYIAKRGKGAPVFAGIVEVLGFTADCIGLKMAW